MAILTASMPLSWLGLWYNSPLNTKLMVDDA
jgi:hypothetical protein